MSIDEARIKAFLEDVRAVCKKHGVEIYADEEGWIVVAEPNSDDSPADPEPFFGEWRYGKDQLASGWFVKNIDGR